MKALGTFLSGLALFALSAFAGCSGSANKSPDVAATQVNANLDEGIEHNLDAALIESNLKKDVTEHVKNGVVMLTGQVSSERSRAEAQSVAADVPNVQQVVNELQVKEQKATASN
jgi:osmotically-inducible protein OsmY